MQQFFLLFILLFSCTTSFCQTTISLKVYQNTDFFKRSEYLYDPELRERTTQENFLTDFNRFSLGLGIESPMSWYHEIEFSYSSDLPPIEHTSSITRETEVINSNFNSTHNAKSKFNYLSLHYEANRSIFYTKSLVVQAGIGITTYGSKSELIPEDSYLHPITEKTLALHYRSSPGSPLH